MWHHVGSQGVQVSFGTCRVWIGNSRCDRAGEVPILSVSRVEFVDFIRDIADVTAAARASRS